MNDLTAKLKELEEMVTHEMQVYVKLVQFANWLEEGVEATDDPMLKRVLANYVAFFSEYIQENESR